MSLLPDRMVFISWERWKKTPKQPKPHPAQQFIIKKTPKPTKVRCSSLASSADLSRSFHQVLGLTSELFFFSSDWIAFPNKWTGLALIDSLDLKKNTLYSHKNYPWKTTFNLRTENTQRAVNTVRPQPLISTSVKLKIWLHEWA